MSKLKSCPFCGGEGVMQQDHRYPDDYDDGCVAFEVICVNPDCVIVRAYRSISEENNTKRLNYLSKTIDSEWMRSNR